MSNIISPYRVLPHVAKSLRILRYKDFGHWAYYNRELPAESSEPGRFKIGRVPPFIEIARASSDPRYDTIAVICSAQISKSENGFNFVSHRIDERAQPAMIVYPTQKLCEKVSRTRFSKILQSSETLSLKHEKGQNDKISLKIIGGAPLIFSYATSASQLCSDAVATVYLDEFDRMPDNVEGEGSPLDIVMARLTTYPNGKAFVTSTPKLVGSSPIYLLWLEGFQARWHIRCIYCNKFTLPSFDLFRWDNDDYREVEEAWLECEHCKGRIKEEHKNFFNKVENHNGRFKALNGRFFHRKEDGTLIDPFELNNTTASFWISGLISPWRSMKKCAVAWLKVLASGQDSRKQAVINTVFGEPYDAEGEAPDQEQVRECCRDYLKGNLVKSCSDVIVMTVDVQGDRLYYVIRGWNTKGESALVDYGCIWGNTEEIEVWGKLFKLSCKKWNNYPINHVFIDAGYNKPSVYSFCKNKGSRFKPVIGRKKLSTPVISKKLEVTLSGKRASFGLKQFSLEDPYFKDLLYAKIREAKEWYIPSNVCEDYCKQVVAEKIVTDGIRVEWKRVGENHYLDCEKIQLMASYVLRIDLFESRMSEEKDFDEKDIVEESEVAEQQIRSIEEFIDNTGTESALKYLSKKKVLDNIWRR